MSNPNVSTLVQNDARYARVYAVNPTGTPAGDQAAMTAVFTTVIAAGSGVIWFNAGTYQPTGPMPTIGRTISINGAGSSLVTIKPTSALTGDLFRVTTAAFSAQQASSISGLTIDGGNASAGACGLHWGDVNGGILNDLVIQNFKASAALTTPVGTDPTTLSKGLWIDNTRATLGITERLELGYVRLYQNSVNILATVQPGMASANQSFYYQRWKHVQISAAGGQVGIWMKNSVMQGAELNVMANLGSTSSNNSWFIYLDGSGADRAAKILDTAITLHIEADGTSGTTYGLLADTGTSFTGNGTFTAYTAGGGATITNASAGTVSLMGEIMLPGIHQSSPVNGWNVITGQAVDMTASPWDLVRATGNITITLPASPVVGQKVGVSREGSVTVTIAANTSQTINGSATAKLQSSSIVTQAMLVFVALSSGSWRIESSGNTDGSLGMFVQGVLNAQGGLGVNVSTISAATTLGTSNSMAYLTGSGGYTVTFGTTLRAGQVIYLLNASSSAIPLVVATGGLINGTTTYSLPVNGAVTATVPVAGSTPSIFITNTVAASSGNSSAVKYGYPYTVDPGEIRSSDSLSIQVVNQAVYQRVQEGGTISKIGLQIATSSGNISVAVYQNSGTGRASVPGTQLATTGTIACPAAGYIEISLPSSVTVAAGDWFALSVDNTTATFRSNLSSVADTGLGAGRQYRQTTAHPLPASPSSLISTIGYTFIMIGV